jgi:hypothetical protein
MSELEARKYTSIRMLREEIRQDMEDYKLLMSGSFDPDYTYLFPVQGTEFNLFREYLNQQIVNKIAQLNELTEQENK